jgi:hypothetical protein
MKIVLNKVTWYSKLLAVFVFAGTIWLGVYFTEQYQEINAMSTSKAPVVSTAPLPPIEASMQWSVDHALYPIPMGGGPAHASVSYFKVVGDTAYVLLNIDLDGWAGVSFAIARAHPIVEKTLLTFPEIKKVVFDVAPGDSRASVLADMQSGQGSEWQTYKNAKRGVEFSYPTNWIMSEGGEGDSFLDIHLSNEASGEGAGCPSKFSAIEAQIGSTKDPKIDFYTYIKSIEGGFMGGSLGDITPTTIGGKKAFQTSYSGWDSGCVGPGFFIEENPSTYTYIFTGNANDSTDKDKLVKIINSFKFTK